MKRLTILGATAVVASLLASGAATAEPLPMVGIGVALPLTGVPGGTIHVPINIKDMLRIEPGIGLIKSSSETKATKTNTSSDSATALSLGVFYMMRPDDKFLVYAGPRFGLVLNDSSDAQDDDTTKQSVTRTDVVLALALGGEHFLAPRFSLGAEVDVGYVMIGESKTETTPATPAPATPDPVKTSSLMSTFGSLFARFYF